MVENVDDGNLIASNLGKLCDSTKHIIDMMEQQNGITEDLFTLADKLLKKAENINALSGYRDWISLFKKAVVKKLGAIVWSDVQYAVYRKVMQERSNYAGSDQECISQLKEVLEGIDMSLKDFELLVLMKIKSNKEFHGNTLETEAHAKERLQMFPDEMECFKEPLQKLFNALDIWNE